MGAKSTRPQGPAEAVAVRAATLVEVALAAGPALVERVRNPRRLGLAVRDLQAGRLGRRASVAEAIGPLLASRRAVLRAGGAQGRPAQAAAAGVHGQRGAVTGSVTHEGAHTASFGS